MRSRLDRSANFQSGVGSDLHVFFPGVVSRKSRLAIAGIAGCGRAALSFAAHGEAFQQRSIKANIELLMPSHSLDVILILPLEPNLDQVFAVDREVIFNGDSAAGSEWQVFALPLVL